MKPVIAAITLGLFAAIPARAGEPLTVLSGDPSGVYFPLGIAIGKLLSDGLPDRTVQLQVTKRSVANLLLLSEGKGEIAFATDDSIEAARRGESAAGFVKPLTNLRSLAALYPNTIQIVATAKSGIRKLADLKGKRLSVGSAKSGTELNARKILAAAGLDETEIGAVKEVSFSESVTQMKDDKLDATLQSAGIGVASINELSNTTDIVMVGIPPHVVEALGPPFSPATIPANTYKGQNDAVPTAAVMNYLVTRADLPDEAVGRLTALIFDRVDIFAGAHPAAHDISIRSAAQAGPLPFHPGAQRYFRGKLKRAEADDLNTRGESRMAKGERAAALADFSAALQIDPAHHAARDNQKALARDIERQGALMGVGRKQP